MVSVSIINKYVEKKEKDLLEYAKILENLISVEDNKMWQNKREFTTYASEILGRYVNLYYFQNNKHRDNPIEYANDNINFVLKSLIDYIKEENKTSILSDLKNETFLLSVIICTSCYVDIASNVIDGNIVDTKEKFKYLLNYLAKTKILKIKDNKYIINDLFEEIKKNNSNDKKVLEAFDSDEYKLTFKMISNNPLYYEIVFDYEIPELKEFDQKLTQKVLKKYEDKLCELKLTLIDYYILKELISNRDMPKYMVKINKSMKKLNISKFFHDNYIKEFVSILIPYEEEVDYQKIINNYRTNEVEVIYDYCDTANINSTIFEDNTKYLVKKEFLINNLDNKNNFMKMNINFIVKNKEEE